MKTTISPEEVEKFSKIANEWWSPTGKFKPLHQFNPIRIAYIRRHIMAHFAREDTVNMPLSGLKLLDIGCGGGLLSEPMARLGAEVTGADASAKNINTALVHALEHNLQIEYLCTTAEDLAQERPETFDVILNMEVIEHVSDPKLFIASCARLLKPNGMMVLATLNRTLKSFAFGIVGAEYILRWLPIGTHDWNKFVKPQEIMKMAENSGLRNSDIIGVALNPLTQKWYETSDLNVNYMGCFVRKF